VLRPPELERRAQRADCRKTSFFSFLAAFCILHLTQPIHAEILFRMDYSEAAWPSAGWWAQIEQYGVRWTRQWVAGAGPQGQNVAQITELPGTGQHGWGWHGHPIPDLQEGGVRYFRWRHRVMPESNCLHTPSNKLFVVSSGCTIEHCRVIVQPKCNPQRMVQYNFQIDGGVFQVETGYIYPVGTWLNVQLEVNEASSFSAEDGSLKLWVNNNNYAQPTIQNLGINLRTGGENSSYVIFGGYNNTGDVPAGATNIQQYTDFEIATDFSSSWSSGTTPPPPSSRCDVNGSGNTDVIDVQQCANQAIGATTCTTGDINQNGSCNVVDVQRVVNAALGGQCDTQ
jgi:hypothetical protein